MWSWSARVAVVMAALYSCTGHNRVIPGWHVQHWWRSEDPAIAGGELLKGPARKKNLKTRLYTADAVWYRHPSGQPTHDVTGCGMTWRDMTWHDVAWYDVTWRARTWHDVTWRGMAWHDVKWRGLTWHDVTWRDVTWSDRHDNEVDNKVLVVWPSRVFSRYCL